MQQEHVAPSDSHPDESVDDFDPFYNENGNYEPHIIVGTNNQHSNRDIVVDSSPYKNQPSLFSDSLTFSGMLGDFRHDARRSHSPNLTLPPHYLGQGEPNVAITNIDAISVQNTEGSVHRLPHFDRLYSHNITLQRAQAIRSLQQARRDAAHVSQWTKSSQTQGHRLEPQQPNSHDNSIHAGVSQYFPPPLSERHDAISHPPTNFSSKTGYVFPKAPQIPSYQTRPYTPGNGYITTSNEYYLPLGPPEPEFDHMFPQVNARVEPNIHHIQHTGGRHNSYSRIPKTRAPNDFANSPPTQHRPRQENSPHNRILNDYQDSHLYFGSSHGAHNTPSFSAQFNNVFTGESSAPQAPKQEFEVTGPSYPRTKAFLPQFNHCDQQLGQIQDAGSRTANEKHVQSIQHSIDTQTPINPRAGPLRQHNFDRVHHAKTNHESAFSTHVQTHQNINHHQNVPIASVTARRLKFENLAQAEAAMADRKLEHDWTPPIDDPTLPEIDSDRIKWVIQLLDAMEDTSVCNDKKDSDTFKNRWANPGTQFHNPQAMEKVCWKLLDIAERLHRNGPATLEVYDLTAMKDVKKSRDLKFRNRMEGICQLLRHSKARCDKLMKGEGLDLAVGCPLQKLSLSIMNHGQNNKRQQYIEEGRVKIKGKDYVSKMKGKKKVEDFDETPESSRQVDEGVNIVSATNHIDDYEGSEYKTPQQNAELYHNDSRVYHMSHNAPSAQQTADPHNGPRKSTLPKPYVLSDTHLHTSSSPYRSPSGSTTSPNSSNFLKHTLDEVEDSNQSDSKAKRPRTTTLL